MFEELSIFQNRYDKVTKLGEGGFSYVFLCQDTKFGSPHKVEMEDKENLVPNLVDTPNIGVIQTDPLKPHAVENQTQKEEFKTNEDLISENEDTNTKPVLK